MLASSICTRLGLTSPQWQHVSLTSGPAPSSGFAAAACPWLHDVVSSAVQAPALPPAGPLFYCLICTQAKTKQNTWAHLKGELRHNSVYGSIAGDVTTYLSSRSTRSCSLLSNQLCLSCSSPSREVAWAFRASQSLASYKNTNKLFCTPLARIKSIGGRRFFYAFRVKMTASHMWYLGTVLVLLFEQGFSSVPLSWAFLQVIKLLLQLPIPTK